MGHVVNEGRLGHVVGEGRVGHVVALCASRTRAILVLFWPVCVCQQSHDPIYRIPISAIDHITKGAATYLQIWFCVSMGL